MKAQRFGCDRDESNAMRAALDDAENDCANRSKYLLSVLSKYISFATTMRCVTGGW